MKFFSKNKALTGIAAAVIIIAVAIITIKLLPANQTITAINDGQEPVQTTATETTTALEITKISETTTVQTTEEIQETTQATVETEKTETKPAETQPPETSPVVEITLAPVEVPDDSVISVLDDNNVQIVENPVTTAQTMPPPSDGMPDGAQGKDEYGNYYKRVDGVKYVWDPVLNWIKDSEDGYTKIMDVEDDGYRFYEEPNGSINTNKVVTPNGDVISYEEYKKIKELR